MRSRSPPRMSRERGICLAHLAGLTTFNAHRQQPDRATSLRAIVRARPSIFARLALYR